MTVENGCKFFIYGFNWLVFAFILKTYFSFHFSTLVQFFRAVNAVQFFFFSSLFLFLFSLLDFYVFLLVTTYFLLLCIALNAVGYGLMVDLFSLVSGFFYLSFAYCIINLIFRSIHGQGGQELSLTPEILRLGYSLFEI